jgi:DNA-binding XRE family transcriptional regulator
MAKPIINDRKLLRMVDQGKTQVEAASFFGVSKQAINKRLKELRGRTTKIVVAKKLKDTIKHKFDALGQLIDINRKTLDLLDEAEKKPEFALKCIGEVRAQLKLASEIYGQMYSVQVVNEFMATITEILKDIDEDAFKEFQRRFNNERSIRSAIRIT